MLLFFLLACVPLIIPAPHVFLHLQYMLRQGKSAVQALHEVEVLTTDYVGEDTLLTSADLGQRTAISPMTVRTIVRGRLHIRTGNIGMLHVIVFFCRGPSSSKY